MSTTSYEFTRPQIADELRETFERPGTVERRELLTALADRSAPKEMIELVAAQLPEGTRLADLRSLWVYLRDVPVERESS